jgi:nucleoside-diphosphate-sugar epimerase
MNVIITGATGFLGKYLLKRFVEDKSNVVVITRNAKKIDEEIRQKITIIESNLAGLKNITNTLAEGCFEGYIFYHFAWEGTSGNIRGDKECQLYNVTYACDALKLAKKMGCKKFIYAGSIMEYEIMKNILRDGYRPGITSYYAISKLTADFMLKTMAANLNVQYINLIISNIYGPGEDSARFLNSVLRKMLHNEPIEMTEGLQLYDFIYLEDAIQAFIAVGLRGEGYASYYIGNKSPRPLRDYIIEMKEILGSDSELRFGTITFKDIGLSYQEFNTNSLESIGANPQISFRQGIVQTKEWIQNSKKEMK